MVLCVCDFWLFVCYVFSSFFPFVFMLHSADLIFAVSAVRAWIFRHVGFIVFALLSAETTGL